MANVTGGLGGGCLAASATFAASTSPVMEGTYLSAVTVIAGREAPGRAVGLGSPLGSDTVASDITIDEGSIVRPSCQVL